MSPDQTRIDLSVLGVEHVADVIIDMCMIESGARRTPHARRL